jgi:hypothetical protein
MKKGMLSSRNGQITIFVIIALVIVAGIGGYFLLKNSNFSVLGPSPEFKVINDNVEKCLENSTLEGIYFIGLQGGYWNVPGDKESYLVMEEPVYVNKGVVTMPSKDTIEKELALAINESIRICINNFEDYKSQGYGFEGGEIKSIKTDIENDKITTTLTWPVKITKEDSTYTLGKFTKEIDFDFMSKYNVVKNFTEEQKKTPTDVPYIYLADISNENKIDVETIHLDNTTVIYTFIFPNKFKDQEFLYSFAARY